MKEFYTIIPHSRPRVRSLWNQTQWLSALRRPQEMFTFSQGKFRSEYYVSQLRGSRILLWCYILRLWLTLGQDQQREKQLTKEQKETVKSNIVYILSPSSHNAYNVMHDAMHAAKGNIVLNTSRVFLSLASKTNAWTSQIKIFTTQGGASTAFVHRGCMSYKKIKVPCSCFKIWVSFVWKCLS